MLMILVLFVNFFFWSCFASNIFTSNYKFLAFIFYFLSVHCADCQNNFGATMWTWLLHCILRFSCRSLMIQSQVSNFVFYDMWRNLCGNFSVFRFFFVNIYRDLSLNIITHLILDVPVCILSNQFIILWHAINEWNSPFIYIYVWHFSIINITGFTFIRLPTKKGIKSQQKFVYLFHILYAIHPCN